MCAVSLKTAVEEKAVVTRLVFFIIVSSFIDIGRFNAETYSFTRIGHFTVVCFVTWLMNVSNAEFYDNCRNSRALIGQILLSMCGQTHEFGIHATRQRARGVIRQFVIVKNKLMLVFNASVLLLTM